MTMPSSGVLNMGGTSSPVSVAQELGLSLTATITMNDAGVRTLAGVGGSGTAWSMNSLYGKSNRVTSNITISANTQNYVLNTAKVTGYSAGKTDVTLTINSGVYVGSSTTGGIGLDVDTSWAAGDTVTIVNNGFIVGCGGAGGAGSSYDGSDQSSPGRIGGTGGTGGPALRVQRAVTINNGSGTIGGGGGGGGGGTCSNTAYPDYYGGGGGGGGRGSSGGGGGGGGAGYTNTTYNASLNGGGGGSGTTASAGSGGGAGWVEAGAGGAGGSWGASGSSGGQGRDTNFGWRSGGSPGGGGNCTTSGSNANITWTSTGTRLGTLG